MGLRSARGLSGALLLCFAIVCVLSPRAGGQVVHFTPEERGHVLDASIGWGEKEVAFGLGFGYARDGILGVSAAFTGNDPIAVALVDVELYPLGRLRSPIQPFVEVGFGLYFEGSRESRVAVFGGGLSGSRQFSKAARGFAQVSGVGVQTIGDQGNPSGILSVELGVQVAFREGVSLAVAPGGTFTSGAGAFLLSLGLVFN